LESVELRQYLIRIAIINWLVSLFIKSPELFTHRDMMDELAEWLWSDTCALEGCENPLLGYAYNARCCCEEHYEQLPETQAYRMAFHKAYRSTPKRKDYQKAYHRVYDKAYSARKKVERIATALKTNR